MNTLHRQLKLSLVHKTWLKAPMTLSELSLFKIATAYFNVAYVYSKMFNPYKPSVLFVDHRQTVQDKIKRRKTLRLIRFFTVCKQKFLLKFE